MSGGAADAGEGVGARPPSGAGAPGDTGGSLDGGTTTSSAAGLPCDLGQLLATECAACHGSPPLPSALSPLVTRADLLSPAKTAAGKNLAEASLAMIQAGTMPPPPAPPPSPAPLQQWIAAGYPDTGCSTAPGSGSGSSDGGVPDPFGAPPVCTSNRYNRGGESASMDPGEACISCHTRSGGPGFSIAGTVYPTAHEPDTCDGVNGGASVVVTDAAGATFTINVNAVGNFAGSAAVAAPFTVKVVSGAKTRPMLTPLTSGDCNACHTQTGTAGAPGRILLP